MLVDGFQQTGYRFASAQLGLIDENLRHEFHPVETRIKVNFANGAVLEAVWPADEEEDGFFFVLDEHRVNLTRLARLRAALPVVGMVPVLSPVDHSEELLSEKYVRENTEGRLASRHFRNQLYLLKREPSDTHPDRWLEFKNFAAPWLTEIELIDLLLLQRH